MRGLGGRRTDDGRQVARRRLFRSGTLHEATPNDRRALEGLGIRVVIDLRSEFEQARQGYEWPAGRRVAAPLAKDSAVAAIFQRFEAGALGERDVEDWWNLTGVFGIPEAHPGSMRIIFRALLEAGPADGVLLHCTGGKDRTGVAVAFILEALGVTRTSIMDDFTLSNVEAAARAAEFVEWMRRATGRVLAPEVAYWLAGVKPEWLDELLGKVAIRYGSVAGYLATLGIGPAEVGALRAAYLEPAEA